jgi:transcriptional regulator with GAF, ATPase, and Fis domain
VGEDTTRKVDVRIIAATNRDLGTEAAAQRFRQDLYYRLSVFPIEIPPVRQRSEDIPALADHFVSHFRSRLNRPEIRLTKADTEVLKRYDWPGNVRELQNVIERAMILSTGTRPRLDIALTQTRSDEQTELPVNSSSAKIVRGDDLKRIERESIVTALERAHWRISGAGGAAELLAINPNTLASRMRSLGIKRKGAG